jgi:hypothetical protein
MRENPDANGTASYARGFDDSGHYNAAHDLIANVNFLDPDWVTETNQFASPVVAGSVVDRSTINILYNDPQRRIVVRPRRSRRATPSPVFAAGMLSAPATS